MRVLRGLRLSVVTRLTFVSIDWHQSFRGTGNTRRERTGERGAAVREGCPGSGRPGEGSEGYSVRGHLCRKDSATGCT